MLMRQAYAPNKPFMIPAFRLVMFRGESSSDRKLVVGEAQLEYSKQLMIPRAIKIFIVSFTVQLIFKTNDCLE